MACERPFFGLTPTLEVLPGELAQILFPRFGAISHQDFLGSGSLSAPDQLFGQADIAYVADMASFLAFPRSHFGLFPLGETARASSRLS